MFVLKNQFQRTNTQSLPAPLNLARSPLWPHYLKQALAPQSKNHSQCVGHRQSPPIWLQGQFQHINRMVAEIDPEAKWVATADGQRIDYDFLIVAPGLVLDNEAIEGFSLDLVGREGIGCLYAGPDYAVRTWQAAEQFIQNGGVAISTRPNTEMKCAGAPLKHTFLIDDLARRGPRPTGYEMHYACPQNTLFSVPIVAEKVRMLYGERGIQSH